MPPAVAESSPASPWGGGGTRVPHGHPSNEFTVEPPRLIRSFFQEVRGEWKGDLFYGGFKS